MRTFGNSTQTDYTYYPWATAAQGERLQYLKSGTAGNPTSLQNLSYGYNAVGNISNITNTLATETNTYGYDALNRLSNWTLNGSAPEQYAYDAASGNLSSKAGATLTYNAQLTTCGASNRTIPHAVSAMGANTYSYDCNGNQTTRVIGGQTFTLGYDAENRLVSVSGPSMTASFVYDGDGNRVKSTVNGTTTTFVGAHYEVTGSTVTKYYFAGTQRVAMRKYTVPSSMAVEYFLGDHLGSTSITTDANGAKVSEMRYKPWGETRYTWTAALSTTPAYALTKYTFTGQYSYMGDFGLMFYNARMYDPALGRFTSADTIIPPGLQGLDRYAYVNNAPVMYVDPSGHTSVCVGSNIDPECNGRSDSWAPPSGVTFWSVNIKLRFGITLSNAGDKDWDESNAELAYDSLVNIETVVGSNLKPHVAGAIFMLSEHHPDKDHPNSTYSGWTDGTKITFNTSGNQIIRQMNFYHEFGHLLNSLPGRDNVFSDALENLDNPTFVGSDGYLNPSALLNSQRVYDPNYGTAEAIQASNNKVTEQWADAFANYIAGNINTTSPFGPGMEMYNFVRDVLTVQLGP